jgi:uncharacterized membrane protein
MVARIQRWGPASGVLFTVLFVASFLISGSSPDSDAKPSKIATYLAKSSAYHRNVVALLVALLALLFLLGFFASLRSRLLLAEGGFDGHAALMYGAGISSAIFLFISVACFVAPVVTAHDARPGPIDPNLYRLTQDLGFLFWLASGVFGAIAIFATSAAAFAGALFPRWFGWLGVVCGILALGTFFFVPVFAYWLWILIAGVILLRRPIITVTAQPVV